ncbi:MAG TPA: GAF domain-containing protein [Solirubrobacterales bacterium]|nr:GAF domain-containing protein [Solirubrobacterales bacterium]
MSATQLVAPTEDLVELDELADAARRALAADAVLIALDPPAGGSQPTPVPVAIVDRFDDDGLERLRRDIGRLDRGLGFRGDEPLLVDFMASRDGAAARLAAGHGFAVGLAAGVTLEGRRIGSVYALRCEPGPFANACLITAYSRQLAISVARHRLGPGAAAAGSTLADLDSALLGVQSLEELSGVISERVAPLFGARLAGVMGWEPQAGMLRLLPGGFGAGRELRRRTQVHVDDPCSNAARVFATGRPYICNEALDDPGVLPEQTRTLGIRRLMTVPLTVAGRRVGILHFANGPEDFGVADLAAAEAVLPRVAAAVELSLKLRDLRHEQRVESILAGVAVAVASSDRGAEILGPTLEAMGEALDADALVLVPARGEPLAWGEAPAEVLVDAAAEPEMRSEAAELGHGEATGHASCFVPVRCGEERYGTLAAWRGWALPFEKEERRALVRLASLAAFGAAAEAIQTEQAESARLRERRRIADGLHDDVAQLLFAAQLNLDAILERADEQTAARVERALGFLVRGDRAIREVIEEISEPAVEPLGERLAAVAAAVEYEFHRAVELDLDEGALLAAFGLGEEATAVLLRVAREGLVNVAKHAGECRAVLGLGLDGEGRLRLAVRDDGVGYSEDAEPGHGLGALRRAVGDCGGELRIGTGGAGGTELTATFAVPGPEGAELDLRAGS